MLKESPDIVFSDARAFVENCREKFDIVFLDPPYGVDASDVADRIVERGLLKENGVIIYEHSESFSVKPAKTAEKTDERRYGAAGFTFYGEKK